MFNFKKKLVLREIRLDKGGGVFKVVREEGFCELKGGVGV